MHTKILDSLLNFYDITLSSSMKRFCPSSGTITKFILFLSNSQAITSEVRSVLRSIANSANKVNPLLT